MCPRFCDPPRPAEQLLFRTACGKDVHVSRRALGDTEAQAQARRVSLRVGDSPDGEDGASTILTPPEARQLAAALLREADAGEGGHVDATTSQVEVSYLGGESYAVATRGHALLTDQPATAGGSDTAMTPTELLVASLSSCVAFYAGRYLARHGLSRDGLRVTASFTIATDRPARVDRVRLSIQVPAGIPPSREAALLAVASHCTVHNTLRQTPGIVIELT